MTDQRLAGELAARNRTRPQDGRGDGGRTQRPSPLALSDVLILCDRHLNEVGRRNHLFGWLRPPGGKADEWLPVDAYYPRNRLVVLYRPRARTHDQVYRELVPEHGLRLLVLSTDELGSTSSGAERALAALLARLDPPAGATRPTTPPTTRSHEAATTRTPATGLTSRSASLTGRNGTAEPKPLPPAAARAERFLATRATDRRRRVPGPTSAESPLIGVAVGLGLCLVLMVAVIYIASTGG